MSHTARRPFAAIVLAAVLLAAETCLATDKVAVLVDQIAYPSFSSRLQRYEEDVESQFPVDLLICKDQRFGRMTPAQIRDYLVDLHQSEAITGVILAGIIPYALWENDDWPETNNRGLCAFYYEDLDGTFTDTDGNGYLDYHTWGANAGPEVWVCWMRPPASFSTVRLQQFLDKTHAYYTGQVAFDHRALVAADEDCDGSIDHEVLNLSQIYQSAITTDGWGPDLVDAADLLNALEINPCETFSTYAHANPWGQAWDIGYIDGSPDMEWLDGGAVMSFIVGCATADFDSAPNDNFVMMHVMSTTNIGQAASGTAWPVGTDRRDLIYDVLAVGGYLGQAWMNLEATKHTPEFMKAYFGEDLDTNRHLWGDVLIGNPFVYALYEPPDQVPPELTITRLSAATYRVAWNKAGNYDLEVSATCAFVSPTVIDVTDLTQYDYVTTTSKAFFRLRAKAGHALPPSAPAPTAADARTGNVYERSGIDEGGNVTRR